MRQTLVFTRHPWVFAAVAPIIAALALSGCGGSGGTAVNGKRVIRVAYSSNYIFYSNSEAASFWQGLARQFDRKYPHATVQLVPIPGSYNDLVAKLDLLYRTPSTAPDVAELPGSAQMGQYVSSGFLAPLDGYVAHAAWWSRFPPVVKSETTLNGHVYAVNQGENNAGLYYNIAMFKKAGIPVPWQPHNWSDILSAAEKLHAALPSDWPVWLQGGAAGGTEAFQTSTAQLLYGSSTPTIYDTTTKKWVVDSQGILQTLAFYHTLAARDLLVPASVLENPNAIDDITSEVKTGNIGIIFANNSLGSAWAHGTCAPCWPQAPKTIGVAYMPTMNGQAPGHVSVRVGAELAMSADSANKGLAWDFINLAEQVAPMLEVGDGAGWIAPDSSLWHNPAYTNFAPPYVAFFTRLLPDGPTASPLLPEENDFSVWAQGLNQATGAIILDKISAQQALTSFKSYVTDQLGAGSVESLP